MSAKRKDTPALIKGVRLTHADKVLFAEQGITKRDVADYLLAVAPRLLPHVKDRLISLVRCPDGQGAPCFFQRHDMAGFGDHVHGFADRKGRDDYIYIDTPEGLVSLAQMGVLEIHLWGSHVGSVEKADRIVFDLDPAPDVPFAAVRDAARRMRDVLAALDLKSYAMLTGGKGVHVVAPIRAEHDWPVVKDFVRTLSQRMAAERPDAYVATMTKAKRTGRIFIDFFRNDRAATAIAPYSPRARVGAPLAWPVSWSALARAKAANRVTLKNWKRSWARDPWAGYHKVDQRLTKRALQAVSSAAGE